MSSPSIYKWSAIDRIGNSLITFSSNIVLARLLMPDDFGLLAMVAIFAGLALNLSSCGLADSLVYKHRPNDDDYSTVFVFNAVLGLFFAALFSCLSSPLASFFHRPEIKGIMIAMGCCFFVQTLSFTQETKMRKELEIKKLAIVRLASSLTVNIMGILMALHGFGYWSLVMTHSGLGVAQMAYFVLLSRWFPKIRFCYGAFRQMFGYGIHLMIAYVITQISRNINTSVLGKFTGPTSAGLYSQAQKLEEVPFGIVDSVLNNPFFSVICNETDPGIRRTIAADMHRRMWWFSLLVMSVLMLVAAPAFHLLYGSKWDGSIPIFRVLLVFGAITAMRSFYQMIMKAYGKPKLVRNLTCAEVALQLALLATVYSKGVIAIAWTLVISSACILAIYMACYSRTLRIPARTAIGEFLGTTLSPALAFALPFFLGMLWHPHAAFPECLFLGGLYAAALIAVCECTRPVYYLQIRNHLLKSIKKK